MMWHVPYSNAWNPWKEFNQLEQEMNRLMGRYRKDWAAPSRDFPAVNVWTAKDDAYLTAELPGIDPDKLELSVKDNTITLRGERTLPKPPEGATYLRRERGSGNFVRTFSLPFKLDAGKVEAQYKTGVLQVRLPRAEEDKPKSIAISVG